MTDTQLASEATVIQTETIALANTATRIGTMFNDLVSNKINNDKIDLDVTLTNDSDSLIPSQKAIKTYADTKQTALVSGTNIKTVNGNALLGSGDLTIGSVTTVKVICSSSDILALNGTPKVLVAAPGAGKTLCILNVSYYMQAGSVAYDTHTDLQLLLGGVVDQTSDTPLAVTANGTEFFSRSLVTQATGGYDVNNASNINSALSLKAVSGNPATGNGTMNVYVTYVTITI